MSNRITGSDKTLERFEPCAGKLARTVLKGASSSNVAGLPDFSFVTRQKRITLDGDNFWVDLVFYHTILKCYCLIDIKTHSLTHADLGQMQLYRNYYDIECRSEGDNQTIGLVLCTKKNKKMVRYFLGENKNIFASKYQLNLPTEEELETELKKEIKEIKHRLFVTKKD